MAIAARNQDELAAAIDRLGPRAHSYVCDVRDHDRIVDLVGAVEGELGPIEVSIHVAGIIHVGPAADVSLAHFDDAIATMLKGPIELAWAVLPGMRRRRRGRIGTVASVGGMVAPPHLLPYATAKFGAVGGPDPEGHPAVMRDGAHAGMRWRGDRHVRHCTHAPRRDNESTPAGSR